MTKKINWKEEFHKMYKMYLDQKGKSREYLMDWKHTLDKWGYYLKIDMIITILIFIGGILLGIFIGRGA